MTEEVGFADEGQEEVDDNADVNEEDAEACEAVAELSDSEDILGMLPTGVVGDASDYKGCMRTTSRVTVDCLATALPVCCEGRPNSINGKYATPVNKDGSDMTK